MPNMSTAGGSMNPQMNQMTSQLNLQVFFKINNSNIECERCDEYNFLVIQPKVAAPMMNQGGMQSNVGPGGMPFASGNMPSMMQVIIINRTI